jgi:uncharacterized protein (DUF302 family)
MTSETLTYGFVCSLGHVPFEEGVEKVTAALQLEGFGVLTTIDVAATLKKKLGVDVPRYEILGACNPTLAHRALQADRHIGLLLPCNVVVQQAPNEDVVVAIADPQAMFSLVENPALAPVVREAEERLRRVIKALE